VQHCSHQVIASAQETSKACIAQAIAQASTQVTAQVTDSCGGTSNVAMSRSGAHKIGLLDKIILNFLACSFF